MPSTIRQRWRRLGALGWALPVVLLLWVPTLYLTLFRGLGFVADDYWHLLAFTGKTYPGGPVAGDLFRFVSGEAADARAAMNEGSFTWYGDPQLKVAFFRPLTSALHAFDHWLFGAKPLLARVHSLAWYVALVVVVSRLFARLLSPRVANLSLLVFVCVAAHWQPVAWIAARNAMISATLACGALLAYVRYRSERSTALLVIAATLYVFSITAGESAFGIMPYFLGYELTLGTGRARERAAALTPFAVLSLVAIGGYAALGYGVAHSSAYLSPLTEPLHFLAELPVRLACMLSFGYLGFPADLWFLEPKLQSISAVLGILSLACGCWLLRVVAKRLESADLNASIWMGLAALGAMVPQAGGLLGSRSMTVPSLGTSAVIAVVLTGAIAHYKDKAAAFPARAAAAAGAGALVALHLVFAPLSWLTTAVFFTDSLRRVSASADTVHLEQAGDQRAILLQVSEVFIYRYLPFERRAQGLVTPSAWHSLSQANYDHVVRRTGPRSFELEVVGGQMLETPMENLDRPRGSPLHIGDRVELDDFSVRVVDAGELGPRRLAVEFRTPLDDPTWLFLIWKSGRLERFHFPAIGQSVRIPFSPPPTAL